MADASAELAAVRGFRSRVPPFASPRHTAAAIATYLVYKHPQAHEVRLRPRLRPRATRRL